MNDSISAKPTPWHLWIIGVVSLLWNAVSMLDYMMIHSRNAVYLSAMNEEQRAFFDDFPLWMEICWTIGVFGGLLGSVLLLLRSRFAVLALTTSFFGMIGAIIYSYVVVNGYEITGMTATVVSALIFLIAFFLCIYAIVMKKRGILT